MSAQSDYTALEEALRALPREQVRKPEMPVAKFVQESKNLAAWARRDRESLVQAGLDWTLVESISQRAGALRQAQALYEFYMKKRQQARLEWDREYPEAKNRRNYLLRVFRLALEGIPGALDSIKGSTHTNSKPQIIRQLMDLSVLGSNYPEALAAVNFDPSLLTEAARLSQQLSALLAECLASTRQQAARDMRDRAYVYLKQAVTRIRKVGKFACWNDKARLPGYASSYFREKVQRYKAKKRMRSLLKNSGNNPTGSFPA